jgi:hypothetical protein
MISFCLLGFISLAVEIHISLKFFHLSFFLIDDLLFKLWLVRLLGLIIDLLLQLTLRLRSDALSLQRIFNCDEAAIFCLLDHTIFV